MSLLILRLKLLYKLTIFINEGKLSFIQKTNEFYLIYLSERDSPKFLSDSGIHEFNQRFFIPCLFQLLGLSSILGSVMSINFCSIFFYVSIFSF